MNQKEFCTATISVARLLEHYVEPERLKERCGSCPKYGKDPACPPHDFDVAAFWQKFSCLELHVLRIPAEASWEDADRQLSDRLKELERTMPGSLCLSSGGGAGDGLLRHSIQALGGNVEKLCRDLLGISLQWAQDGKMPEQLTLVGGLLRKTGGTEAGAPNGDNEALPPEGTDHRPAQDHTGKAQGEAQEDV